MRVLSFVFYAAMLSGLSPSVWANNAAQALECLSAYSKISPSESAASSEASAYQAIVNKWDGKTPLPDEAVSVKFRRAGQYDPASQSLVIEGIRFGQKGFYVYSKGVAYFSPIKANLEPCDSPSNNHGRGTQILKIPIPETNYSKAILYACSVNMMSNGGRTLLNTDPIWKTLGPTIEQSPSDITGSHSDEPLVDALQQRLRWVLSAPTNRNGVKQDSSSDRFLACVRNLKDLDASSPEDERLSVIASKVAIIPASGSNTLGVMPTPLKLGIKPIN